MKYLNYICNRIKPVIFNKSIENKNKQTNSCIIHLQNSLAWIELPNELDIPLLP